MKKQLIVLFLFFIWLGGSVLSDKIYKYPPLVSEQTYDSKTSLPIPTPGRPLGGPIIRGYCITWMFPFVGKEIYVKNVSGIDIEQCQAIWTGEAHGIGGLVTSLLGLLGTIICILFVMVSVSNIIQHLIHRSNPI